MTIYFVAYYNGGQWNISEAMLQSATAQNALTWYQTIPGTTYAVILSWTATNAGSWGTPPV